MRKGHHRGYLYYQKISWWAPEWKVLISVHETKIQMSSSAWPMKELKSYGILVLGEAHCTPPRCFYPQTPQNRKHSWWIHRHPTQLGWDSVMRHTPALDTVGAAERCCTRSYFWYCIVGFWRVRAPPVCLILYSNAWRVKVKGLTCWECLIEALHTYL